MAGSQEYNPDDNEWEDDEIDDGGDDDHDGYEDD